MPSLSNYVILGDSNAIHNLRGMPGFTREDARPSGNEGVMLSYAAEFGHADVIRVLGEAPYNLNGDDARSFNNSYHDDDGQTLLTLAAAAGHADVIRVLGEPPYSLNGDDARVYDTLAVLLAAENHHANVIEVLAEPPYSLTGEDIDYGEYPWFGDDAEVNRVLSAPPYNVHLSSTAFTDDDSDDDIAAPRHDIRAERGDTASEEYSLPPPRYIGDPPYDDDDSDEDYIYEMIEFTPDSDPDTPGKGYMDSLYDISSRYIETDVPPTLNMEFVMSGSRGVDYSGVFRQVVSQFLEYWMPSYDMRFTAGSGAPLYKYNFPRCNTAEECVKLGVILIFLTKVVVENPTIHGQQVNISMDIMFDNVLLGILYGDGDGVMTPYALFKKNLSSASDKALVDRSKLITERNWEDYAFVEDIGRMITATCSDAKAIQDHYSLKYSGYSKNLLLLLRLIIYVKSCPYMFEKEEILEGVEGVEDEASARESISTMFKKIIITENEYLRVWLDLYFSFLRDDKNVSKFIETLYPITLVLNKQEFANALAGDGFLDDTVRPELISRLTGIDDDKKYSFIKVLEEMEYDDVRKLLFFWTGSSQLKGALKITAIEPNTDADAETMARTRRGRLPVSHTCFNDLEVDIRYFSSAGGMRDHFRDKILTAISVVTMDLV